MSAMIRASSALRRARTKGKRDTIRHLSESAVELPQELIDEIFNLAASASKSTSMALACVSRSSRRLVIPIVFESLTFEHRADAFTHVEMLRANPAIATVVKALWIRECTPREVELFVLCTNLERLAVTPQAFSALCRFGNSVWRQRGRDAMKLALPRELLLFPGVVDWDMPNEDRCVALSHRPYSASLLTNLSHLYLSQSSQFISLQTTPLPLSSLTQLATPLAGTSLSPRDVIGSYRFPNLRLMSVLPRQRNDPGLSPRSQFAALQWDADGLTEKIEKDERVEFVDVADVSDAQLFEDWKNNRNRL